MNLGGHVVLTGSWSQYEHPLSGRAEFASAATLEAVIRRKLTLGVAPPLQNRDMFTKQSLERLRQGQNTRRVHVVERLSNAPRIWLRGHTDPEQGATVIKVEQ